MEYVDFASVAQYQELSPGWSMSWLNVHLDWIIDTGGAEK